MHNTCPFPDQSGFECVEFASNGIRTFCEVGLNCVAECEHSFAQGSDAADDAINCFKEKYPIDEY